MDLGGHKFPVERDVSKPSSDPPYAADFYSVLGRIITAWGAIERTLDLTFYAARNLNSRNAISGPTTTSLGRKVKALRLAIEAYDGFKDSDKRVLGTVLDDVLHVGRAAPCHRAWSI
jgi:hypothetical protein